jgi:hypothetical protein
MHRESDCAVFSATVSSALMLPSVKAWHVYASIIKPEGGATVSSALMLPSVKAWHVYLLL